MCPAPDSFKSCKWQPSIANWNYSGLCRFGLCRSNSDYKAISASQQSWSLGLAEAGNINFQESPCRYFLFIIINIYLNLFEMLILSSDYWLAFTNGFNHYGKIMMALKGKLVYSVNTIQQSY